MSATDGGLPHVEQLANGLTLIGQQLVGVRAAAFALILPGGSSLDPPGRWGVANITAELVFRGAGERDSRSLQCELDRLGVVKSVGAEREATSFAAATQADNLPLALELFADTICRPHLAREQFEAVRALTLQEIRAAEDDPNTRVMRELKWKHWPEPYGAPPLGTLDSVTSIQHDDVRQYWEKNYRPGGAVLAVAGHFDWDNLLRQVTDLFGQWRGETSPPEPGPRPDDRRVHLKEETAQSHLAIAFDTVPFAHPDYYAIRAAVAVLSGGSSSRLFTELREKRGLCYAVSASYVSLRQLGTILGYVGTSPETARQALDVFLGELDRLGKDLSEEELERARARLKSALIMGNESTFARANMLARDWYYLGRVRTLDEVQEKLDSLTVEHIQDSLQRHPFRDFTIVCLGPTAPWAPPSGSGE